MHFTKLVPNIFYTDVNAALKFFIDCLEFTVSHDEMKTQYPFCVIEKDGLRINLFKTKNMRMNIILSSGW